MDWETKVRSLGSGYGIEVDTVDQDTWTDILLRFADASIHQTWAYGAVRCGQENLSHLVMRKDDKLVAAAQVRIVRVPLISSGIAYIAWGPLYRLQDTEEDLEIFRHMARALRNEYVVKRGLLLRILPNVFDQGAGRAPAILQEEGFENIPSGRQYRTLLIDLSPSLEELRAGLHRKWRNHLNRAERNGLEIRVGQDGELYDAFADMYREMHRRKRFAGYENVDEFRLIQEALPASCKMRIMVCISHGQPGAAIVCPSLGDTGTYLLGATNRIGLETKGAYLLQWRMVEWLKANAYQWYDLCGVDPAKNPAGYHFKVRLAGKNGKEARHIGQFDACSNLVSHLSVMAGDVLRSNYGRLKERIGSRVAVASPGGG